MSDQMDWLKRLHEPFFRSEQDAEAYVTRELALAVPEGWGFSKSSGEHLTWIIKKEKLEPKEWPNQGYCVRVSSGLELMIFTFGNTDARGFNLQQVLQTALVIGTVMLRKFSLGECVRSLFADRKPDEWGYT
jgi:hypothetical protein